MVNMESSYTPFPESFIRILMPFQGPMSWLFSLKLRNTWSRHGVLSFNIPLQSHRNCLTTASLVHGHKEGVSEAFSHCRQRPEIALKPKKILVITKMHTANLDIPLTSLMSLTYMCIYMYIERHLSDLQKINNSKRVLIF